jgi:preprotein translocase subunit SecB
MPESESQDTAAESGGQKRFALQKVYLKDVSFEAPNTPEIFTREWRPELDVQMNWTYKRLADEVIEVVLVVTVTTNVGNATAFLAEVQQAGIFAVQGFDDEELETFAGRNCPKHLYPFAREAVADLTGKGGFPQLLLQPVNFRSMYEQRKQAAEAGAGQSTG